MPEQSQNRLTGCFEIFAKINGKRSDNFKYVRTQFYRKISEITDGCTATTKAVHKHKYRTVSIPKSYSKSPKFRQKGIVFIWPQRKKVYHREEMILVTWFLAHALFWLNNMNLLPNGAATPLKQPPWEYRPPAKKPENRDYIIEPDWGSCSSKKSQ